jgi:hypothetical protein
MKTKQSSTVVEPANKVHNTIDFSNKQKASSGN